MRTLARAVGPTLVRPLPTGRAAAGPAASSGSLPLGTLLNNIYEIRRFLARGGMGEVYEGVNVNTDERVAIKVILPELAVEPKMQALFRKEARILTELAHPALVRYRLLAQEPALGCLYIVTEFIAGRSLAETLGELRPSLAELKILTRRLAEGLGAAHALGAVHRDMSPDNVLLPDGRIDQAKIIDFGIAREAGFDPHTAVGETFAGKMSFVAPEQLGDFDRRVGPWTDVYSLGLVVLAAAQGKVVDMGATLAGAVDRRREGVELSALPAPLRPVFGKMLAPNPADRFQSMAEVLEALDAPYVPQPEQAELFESHEPSPLPMAAYVSKPADFRHSIGTTFVSLPPLPAAPSEASEPPLFERFGLAGALPRSSMSGVPSEPPLAEAPVRLPSRASLIAGGWMLALGLGVAVAFLGAPPRKPAQTDAVAAQPKPVVKPPEAQPELAASQAAIIPVAKLQPAEKAAAKPDPAPVAARPPEPKKAVANKAAPPAQRMTARERMIARAKAKPIWPAGVTVPSAFSNASTTTAAASPTPRAKLELQPASKIEPAAKGVEACWRAAGSDWTYLGYATRGACASQAFDRSCKVVHARWGKGQLRRYNGRIEAKGSGALSRWRALGPSTCPEPAAAP